MVKIQTYQVRGLHFLVLSVITFGLILMLFSAIIYRLGHAGLVVESPSRPQPAEQIANVQSEASMLMQRLQANPLDFEVLIKLADFFVDAHDFANAEVFAVRAIAAQPAEARGHYLYGVALSGQDKYADAAKSLEQAIKLKDTPEVRYGLGVLYSYYLNDAKTAKEHFEVALQLPNLSPNIQKALNEELSKLNP